MYCKYDKKKLIIFADAGIAVATLILAFAIPYISAERNLLLSLLVILAIRSVGAGVQMPAVNAVIPVLVPEENLMKFNGINATMQSVVQFAAPAAAGAILTFASLRGALLIDVGTAAIGLGLLACVLIPRTAATANCSTEEITGIAGNDDSQTIETDEPVSVLDDMKIGVHYTFKDRFLSRLLGLYGIFIFLCVPAGFLATLLVSRVYGDTYWYLTAVEVVGFAGMAIGGLIMGTWGGFKNRVKTLLIGMLIFGVLAVGMGLSKNFILYLALMALYGVALTAVQTATTTLIMERAAEEMQGRVFGLLGTMYSGFLPVGMVVFGPLADVIPLQWIMIGTGALLAIVAVAMRIDKKFYVE